MSKRDITGTDAQGVRSGPRPDQGPHAITRDLLAPSLARQVRYKKEDEETDPVADVDDLGAAVEGDGDRAVDDTKGKLHVKKVDSSRTL